MVGRVGDHLVPEPDDALGCAMGKVRDEARRPGLREAARERQQHHEPARH